METTVYFPKETNDLEISRDDLIPAVQVRTRANKCTKILDKGVEGAPSQEREKSHKGILNVRSLFREQSTTLSLGDIEFKSTNRFHNKEKLLDKRPRGEEIPANNTKVVTVAKEGVTKRRETRVNPTENGIEAKHKEDHGRGVTLLDT